MIRMNKIFYLLPFCLILSSCKRFLNLDLRTEKEFISDKIQEVITYTENKDKEKLRGLISTNTLNEVEDIDKQMDDLFDYYKGNKTSYTIDYGGESDRDGKGGNTKTLWVSTDITTTEDVFRVAFDIRTVDTIDPKNKGIPFIFIIRFDDDPNSSAIFNGKEMCFTYWGDGTKTPGIHIGKVHVNNKNEN